MDKNANLPQGTYDEVDIKNVIRKMVTDQQLDFDSNLEGGNIPSDSTVIDPSVFEGMELNSIGIPVNEKDKGIMMEWILQGNEWRPELTGDSFQLDKKVEDTIIAPESVINQNNAPPKSVDFGLWQVNNATFPEFYKNVTDNPDDIVLQSNVARQIFDNPLGPNNWYSYRDKSPEYVKWNGIISDKFKQFEAHKGGKNLDMTLKAVADTMSANGAILDSDDMFDMIVELSRGAVYTGSMNDSEIREVVTLLSIMMAESAGIYDNININK